MPDKDGLLQAILFVAGDSVSVEDLSTWTGLDTKALNEVLERLADDRLGVVIRRFGDKVQMVTNPKYADQLREIFAPESDGRLSTSLLETLAIVAYRQPVTRLEIEEIRGVRCAYALSVLTEKGLIEKTGTRAVLGHPAEYGTTDEFLRQFDLRSLDDLPPVESEDARLPALPV